MPDTFGIPTDPIDREPLDYPTPGVYPSAIEREGILRDAFRAAGIELGTYDDRIARWLAQTSDWSTFAVMVSWVVRAAQRAPAPTVALPGRFDATPGEVDQHLRRILAEGTYLRYQQAIGDHAVEEAAQDARDWADGADIPGSPMPTLTVKGWEGAADHIDPAKDGGPYPSQLLCSQHDGFGPCPGWPHCAPKDNPR